MNLHVFYKSNFFVEMHMYAIVYGYIYNGFVKMHMYAIVYGYIYNGFGITTYQQNCKCLPRS